MTKRTYSTLCVLTLALQFLGTPGKAEGLSSFHRLVSSAYAHGMDVVFPNYVRSYLPQDYLQRNSSIKLCVFGTTPHKVATRTISDFSRFLAQIGLQEAEVEYFVGGIEKCGRHSDVYVRIFEGLADNAVLVADQTFISTSIDLEYPIDPLQKVQSRGEVFLFWTQKRAVSYIHLYQPPLLEGSATEYFNTIIEELFQAIFLVADVPVDNLSEVSSILEEPTDGAARGGMLLCHADVMIALLSVEYARLSGSEPNDLLELAAAQYESLSRKAKEIVDAEINPVVAPHGDCVS